MTASSALPLGSLRKTEKRERKATAAARGVEEEARSSRRGAAGVGFKELERCSKPPHQSSFDVDITDALPYMLKTMALQLMELGGLLDRK